MGEGDGVIGAARARDRRRSPSSAAPRGSRSEEPCATTRRWPRRWLAGRGPPPHRAEPLGRLRARRATARSSARARPNRPAGRTPKSRRSRAAGDRGRGATAYVTLEPCSHRRPHAARAPTLLDRRRRRAGRRRARRPRSARRGRGRRAAARGRASTSTVGVERRGRRRELAPYLHHRRTGRPFVVAKVATSLDGRVAAADGTSQWITSARRARRCARAARRLAGDRRRRGHRARRPARAHRARRRARAERPPLRVLARRPRARARDRAAVRHAARADARRHHRRARRRARSTRGRAAGAKVEVVAPGADGAASTSTRRSRCSGARACSRCWSKAAARCSVACSRAATRNGSSSTSRRCCSATRGTPGFRLRRSRRRSPTRPRYGCATCVRSAPTSGSTTSSTDRRRRLMFTGIVEELGRVRAVTPNEGGARIEIDAQARARRRRASARRSRSTAAASRSSTCGDDWWAADAVIETLARTNLGDLARRRPREPRTAGAPRRPARRPPRAGPRRRDRHRASARPQPDGSTPMRDRSARRRAALRRAQGIDHRRRHQPHRRRARTTTASTIAVIPHTLAVTTLGTVAAGAPREPRSRLIAKYVERLVAATRAGARHDVRRSRTSHRRGQSAVSSSSSSTTRTARTRATSSSRPRR